MQEKSAQGVRGHILYHPFRCTHFFRVYHDEGFTDYEIVAEDIEVTIEDGSISLYTGDEESPKLESPKIDFNSQVLGRKS